MLYLKHRKRPLRSLIAEEKTSSVPCDSVPSATKVRATFRSKLGLSIHGTLAMF